MKKNSLIFLLIFFLLSIMGAVSLVSPVIVSFVSTDLEGKWETYVNKQIGYSVSYPASWKISESTGGKPDQYGKHAFNVWDRGITFMSFYQNPPSYTIERLMNDKSYAIEDKEINGQSFTVFNSERGLNAGDYVISNDKKVIIYIINNTSDSSRSTYEARDKIILEILQSLKRVN